MSETPRVHTCAKCGKTARSGDLYPCIQPPRDYAAPDCELRQRNERAYGLRRKADIDAMKAVRS